jgi:hypothetical protein
VSQLPASILEKDRVQRVLPYQRCPQAGCNNSCNFAHSQLTAATCKVCIGFKCSSSGPKFVIVDDLRLLQAFLALNKQDAGGRTLFVTTFADNPDIFFDF